MFCLRSWLPLLFIPTNASPAFIFLFFVCTYFLNRPCIYCSFLLLILFMTSCNWSDRCFFDFSSNWFQPRPGVSYFTDGTTSFTCVEAGACAGHGGADGGGAAALSAVENMTATANATYLVAKDTVNATANAMMGAAAEQVAQARSEWTGIGMEWLRNLLGKREWRIDCLDVYIRL
ncbi:bladder cancer-related protein BC10-domain-containing protein [Diaporthe sp. PMI_573]|nr:bladder cancer-related protein BC10-domain-containing protein [Diaporthaceae sp. PMI_573]